MERQSSKTGGAPPPRESVCDSPNGRRSDEMRKDARNAPCCRISGRCGCQPEVESSCFAEGPAAPGQAGFRRRQAPRCCGTPAVLYWRDFALWLEEDHAMKTVAHIAPPPRIFGS
ncbi:MAG: hypothetical protein OXU61_02955 [Gammaproteobacteria bacterium]|nr:hypothetical protein [Gammaproteobacteria bacterium]